MDHGGPKSFFYLSLPVFLDPGSVESSQSTDGAGMFSPLISVFATPPRPSLCIHPWTGAG